MAQILNYPNAYIGLSDGGAHVQFHGGYGYSTRLLGDWVRAEAGSCRWSTRCAG